MKNTVKYARNQAHLNQLHKLTESQQLTFWYLQSQSKRKSLLYMSQGHIGEILGYCRETINRAVKMLHCLGYIIKRNRGVKVTCLYSFDFPKPSNLFSSKCHTISRLSDESLFSTSRSPRIYQSESVVDLGGGLPKSSTRGLEWIKSLEEHLTDEDKTLLHMSSVDSGCAYCETAYWLNQTPSITCECDPIKRVLTYFDHFILLG